MAAKPWTWSIYEATFRESEIDTDILPVTDQDLEKLGVPLGHRKRLLKAIGTLGSTDHAPGAVPASARPSIDTAERRQVTVMFSDLVGSTALSARMDPEDLREVISAYQKCVADTVARFGGYVAKYMGDGVLVNFGYPHAHEDDAERAVAPPMIAPMAAPRPPPNTPPMMAPVAPPTIAPPTGSCAAASCIGIARAMARQAEDLKAQINPALRLIEFRFHIDAAKQRRDDRVSVRQGRLRHRFRPEGVRPRRADPGGCALTVAATPTSLASLVSSDLFGQRKPGEKPIEKFPVASQRQFDFCLCIGHPAAAIDPVPVRSIE